MVSMIPSIVFSACVAFVVLQQMAIASSMRIDSCELLSGDSLKTSDPFTRLTIDNCDSWNGERATLIPEKVSNLGIGNISAVSPSSLSFSDRCSLTTLVVGFSTSVKLSDIVNSFGNESPITKLVIRRAWPETYQYVTSQLRKLAKVLVNLKALTLVIDSAPQSDLSNLYESDATQLKKLLKLEELGFRNLKLLNEEELNYRNLRRSLAFKMTNLLDANGAEPSIVG